MDFAYYINMMFNRYLFISLFIVSGFLVQADTHSGKGMGQHIPGDSSFQDFAPSKITEEHVKQLEAIIFGARVEREQWENKREDAKDLRHLFPDLYKSNIKQATDREKSARALRGLFSTPYGTNLRKTLGHQIRHFPIEALIFYAAIGATMFRKSLIDSHGLAYDRRDDPMWLENFAYEFTSPVGIFSFFCFVLASGATRHIYSKGTTLYANHRYPVRQQIGSVLKGDSLKPRPRVILGGAGAFSGQLGMALGLMASNIVHEWHTMRFHNPLITKCIDTSAHTTIPKDKKMACDFAYDEFSKNAWSWAPMLGSMLTASILAHNLVSVGKRGLARSGIAKAVKAGSNHNLVSVGKRGLARSGIAKAVKAGSNLLFFGGPTTWFTRGLVGPLLNWFGRHRIGSRFIHLYAFMEVDDGITHPLFDKYITEPMKARYVSAGTADFVEAHHNVNYLTEALSCPAGNNTCNYHPSLMALHKTANNFDHWRSHKMMTAQFAQHNWTAYVSKTLGAFDIAYEFYKLIFRAKTKATGELEQINYFGHNIAEDEAILAFQKMRQHIESSANSNLSYPLGEQSVISIEKPSRFLKEEHKLQALLPNDDEETHLAILTSLFSVADPIKAVLSDEKLKAWDQKLKPLYGSEWDHAFNKEIQKLRNQITVFRQKGIEPGSLEEETISKAEGKLPTQVRKNLRDRALSAGAQYLHWIVTRKTSHNRGLSSYLLTQKQEQYTVQTKRLLALKGLEKPNCDNVSEAEQTEIQELSLKISQKDRDFIAYIITTRDNLCSRESLLKAQHESFTLSNNCVCDTNESKKLLTTSYFAENPSVLPHNICSPANIDKGTLWANYRQTQNRRIEGVCRGLFNQSNGESADVPLHFQILFGQLKEQPAQLPVEVKKAIHLLGADSIFAQLYELGYQIKPLAHGRPLITEVNKIYDEREQEGGVKYHPRQVGTLQTPHIMDFLLVSAVCGPDLTTHKQHQQNRALWTQSEEQAQSQSNPVPINTQPDSIAQGVVAHSQQLAQKFEEQTKQEVLKDEERRIMEKTTAILGRDIPVFNNNWFRKTFGGQASYFFPPRMTTMDEKDRRAICSGVYSQDLHGVVKNIYDSHFKVGDKEYTSLLEVVKDHIGLKGVSSAEVFEKWWSENVIPYRFAFRATAQWEHQHVVQAKFFKALFQNNINTSATMDSQLYPSNSVNPSATEDTTDSACEEQSGPFVSVWDKVSCFSKGWFTKTGLITSAKISAETKEGTDFYTESYKTKTFSDSSATHQEYELNLPEGFFHNVYFEAHYWADILLHFAKKRNQYFIREKGEEYRELLNIEKLELGLDKIISLLKVSDSCLKEKEELGSVWYKSLINEQTPFFDIPDTDKDEAQKECRKWLLSWKEGLADKRINPLCDEGDEITPKNSVEGFWKTLCDVVAYQGLYIDMNKLIDFKTGRIGQEQNENFNRLKAEENQHEAFSYWTNRFDYTSGKDSPVVPLPDQIINYSLGRLYDLMETVQYQATMTDLIFYTPQVKSAIESPL